MSTTDEDKSKKDSGEWFGFDAYDPNIEPAPVPPTAPNDNQAPDIISSTSNMIIPFTTQGRGPLEEPLPDEHPSTPSKKRKVTDAKPMEDIIANM